MDTFYSKRKLPGKNFDESCFIFRETFQEQKRKFKYLINQLHGLFAWLINQSETNNHPNKRTNVIFIITFPYTQMCHTHQKEKEKKRKSNHPKWSKWWWWDKPMVVFIFCFLPDFFQKNSQFIWLVIHSKNDQFFVFILNDKFQDQWKWLPPSLIHKKNVTWI